MFPDFLHNDYLLVCKWPWRFLTAGTAVLVLHPEYGEIVKYISEKRNSGEVLLQGNNSQSVSSEKMGLIPPQQILGKVVWHIRAGD